MADQPTTPSGSRWEPDPDATTPTAAGTPLVPPDPPEPAEPYAAAELDPDLATPEGDQAVDERRAQLRGRAVLAGAATALALGGGITGFVIGHSAAGDDSNGFSPAGFTGRPNGGPQGGQLGEGQQPPGFHHDGDRDDDGDDDDGEDGDRGFSPSLGSTDGGSSSSSSSNGAGATGNPT